MLQVFLCTGIAYVNNMCKIFGGGVVYLEGCSIWGRYRRPKMAKTILHPGCFIWTFTVTFGVSAKVSAARISVQSVLVANNNRGWPEGGHRGICPPPVRPKGHLPRPRKFFESS